MVTEIISLQGLLNNTKLTMWFLLEVGAFETISSCGPNNKTNTTMFSCLYS